MSSRLNTILQLEVPVIVQIGRLRMSLDDVLALQPGSILELDKHADDELAVLINNKPVGSGAAVKVGENFGLKLTLIGSPRERIEALGDDVEADADAPDTEPVAASATQAPADE